MTQKTQKDDSALLGRVLAHYGKQADRIAPLGAGLINRTYWLREKGSEFVLQWINPIFPAITHVHVRAVTEHLHGRGVLTPRVVSTIDGNASADLGNEGIWRLMTYIEGTSVNTMVNEAMARVSGALVGRFHAALDSLDYGFEGARGFSHDTEKHLALLRETLYSDAYKNHRLYGDTKLLGEAILKAAQAMPALPDLPMRICHGDLKVNNIVFEGKDASSAGNALCLVDLDTVGPMALAHELGDAWRSWCNPKGEDSEEIDFNMPIFSASLHGYIEGLGRDLSGPERKALLYGVEWIALELSSRFAADALRECYFGWNSERFAGRGEHNLLRAQGQWKVFRATLECRDARARTLNV